MTGTWTVIVCGGCLVFAIVGLIILGAPKRKPWPPPPPLAMFPPELQALIVRDSIARREVDPPAADPIADMFAVRDGILADVHALAALPGDELAKLRAALGADDDGKPVESMRARADDLDTMRDDGSWRV